uniref:Repressor protein CI n=1 Tax=Siphoviridae sp. ctGz830 TaxID=2827825 RepID=A0A8S5T9N0_9CAUD|nr:MAG TPA: Repressor protein CI [Siphoviridae sp. ctGz830]
MNIGDKIRKLREEKGLSQEELAQKMGYKSKTSIHKIEQGITDLPLSKVSEFANILNTTSSYLMGWEDEPMIQPRFKNAEIIKSVRKKKLPLVGNIACGSPILNFNDTDEVDYIDADEDIVADFALRCVGDSMINARIEDGDLVFIDKDARVKDGDIAAVSIDFEITLKRVYFKENSVVLMAENPKIPPRIFEFKEESQVDFRILGKAVAFQSML